MTVSFDVIADEAPLPASTRGRTTEPIDPKVETLYRDTLKPRGVPSSSALVLKVPTVADADKLVRELRQLAEKDEPRVSVSKRTAPVKADEAAGEQQLTVWLSTYVPRVRKPKDAAKADEPVSASAEDTENGTREPEADPVANPVAEPVADTVAEPVTDTVTGGEKPKGKGRFFG